MGNQSERAVTAEQKKHVVDRILDIWNRHPTLRLGQLLDNAGLNGGVSRNLYYLEDFKLIQELEDFYREAE